MPPVYLLPRLATLAGKVRKARRLAIFCDFDGTLVGFRLRPESVFLRPATRSAIRCLARHPRTQFWIVTGRKIADVRRHVRIHGVRYVGLHGWETDHRQVAPQDMRAARARLGPFLQDISVGLAPWRSVRIEDKGVAIAVHYRGARPRTVKNARRALQSVLQSSGRRLRVIPGCRVWEVVPPQLKGKGAAVRSILASLPGRPLVIYAGDDTADESAFAQLPRAVTIKVGKRGPTRARFFLRNPEEVARLLSAVARAIR